MKFRRGYKKWADNEALRWRKELGLKKSDPLPARVLLDHLKIPYYPLDKLEGDPVLIDSLRKTLIGHWSAVAIKGKGQWFIVHHDQHSPARQESDIMHEISHILCEHSSTSIDDLNGIPLLKYNHEQEEEAKWLGGCLQLPVEALTYCLFNDITPQMISEKYTASSEMVKYRLNVSGAQRIFDRAKSKITS